MNLLHPYQQKIYDAILDAYQSGKKSVRVVMPWGTGKSFLAYYLARRLARTFNFDAVAYISMQRGLQHYFLLDDSLDTLHTDIIQGYLLQDIVTLVERNEISATAFQLIIFDDFERMPAPDFEKVFHFFKAFKVAFSGDLAQVIAGQKQPAPSSIFDYVLEPQINASFIESEMNVQDQLFSNFATQLDEVDVGDAVTPKLKRELSERLDLLRQFSEQHLDVLKRIITGEINIDDINELIKRRQQLEEFGKLLNDEAYFKEKIVHGKTPERVWQDFFERNKWIFGFGLNYIFNTPLEGQKLEQTVVGFSIGGHGKRIDALLKTTGMIQSLCFGEIKTHQTELLKLIKIPYRADCWAASDETAGGIAQLQKTVQKSLDNIQSELNQYDPQGYKQPDTIYLYKPKSFLLIGSLAQFKNENGQINTEKFASFELFRKSIQDIEILTFDELYERAKALVNQKWI